VDVTFTPKRASRSCLALSMASPLRAARCRCILRAANTSATASPMPFDAPVIRAGLVCQLKFHTNLRDAIQIYKSKQFAYQEIGRLLEGCEKVEEVVAKQINVVAHGCCGPAPDRGQIACMIACARDGVGDPVRHARHPTADKVADLVASFRV